MHRLPARTGTSSAATATGTHASVDSGMTTASLPTLAPSFTGTTGGAIYSTPAVASGRRLRHLRRRSPRRLRRHRRHQLRRRAQHLHPAVDRVDRAVRAPSPGRAAPSPRRRPWSTAASSWARPTGSSTPSTRPGSTNCSGSPKTCTPVWTANTGGAIYGVAHRAAATSSTSVRPTGSSTPSTRTGVTNCGGRRSARRCGPRRPEPPSTTLLPSATGRVYVGSTDGKLYAFDAAGVTNCSAGVCSPLWTAATGGLDHLLVTVGDGGVARVRRRRPTASSTPSTRPARPAARGAPKTCAPLWTMATGGSIVSSPAVVEQRRLRRLERPQALRRRRDGHDQLLADRRRSARRCGRRRPAAVVRSSPAVAGSDGVRRLRRPPRRRLRRHRHHQLLGQPRRSARRCGRPRPARAVASSPIVAKGAVYFGSLDHSLYADKPWVAPRRPARPTRTPASAPASSQDAYELPSTVAGAGRTVAIVDAFDDPNAESDLAVYRAQYGLPACTTANGCFKKLNQTGVAGSYPAGNPGWGEEISLDVDTVSAICPLCHITLVEANTNATSNLVAAEVTAGGPSPDGDLQQLGVVGVQRRAHPRRQLHLPRDPGHRRRPATTATAPTWPASAPNVTAVGGTDAHRRQQRPRLVRDGVDRRQQRLLDPGGEAGVADRLRAAPSAPSPTCPRWPARRARRSTTPTAAIRAGSDFGGTSLASPIIASVYALAYPDAPMSSTYANHVVAVRRHLGFERLVRRQLPVHRRGRLRRAHRPGHAVRHRQLRHRSVRDAGLFDPAPRRRARRPRRRSRRRPRTWCSHRRAHRPQGRLRPLRRRPHHQAVTRAASPRGGCHS